MMEPYSHAVENPFAAPRQQFEAQVAWLQGTGAIGLSHSQLEERLQRLGWETQRLLLQPTWIGGPTWRWPPHRQR